MLGTQDKSYDEISQVNPLKLLKLFWTKNTVKMVFVGDPKQLTPFARQKSTLAAKVPISSPKAPPHLRFDNGVTRSLDRQTALTMPRTVQRMPVEVSCFLGPRSVGTMRKTASVL